LHFLKSLPPQLSEAQMRELDQAFKLTQTGNAEIVHEWATRSNSQPLQRGLSAPGSVSDFYR
jgi:hypothetical protein